MKPTSSLVHQFTSSVAEFLVAYPSIQQLNFSKLLVLDSSFNPPHIGHLNLIHRAIEYYDYSSKDFSVMLQLSVNNADKAPKPASFERRLDMMKLFAQEIEAKWGCNCFVVLTKHAKFVDKSTAIRSHFNQSFHIVYLLGFDTLIRLFDSKYYVPDTVETALETFMQETDLYCLTRDCNNDEQNKWLHESAPIPKSWIPKIALENNLDSATNSVSSSEIRKALQHLPTDKVDKLLTPRVLNYIKAHSPNSIF